MNGLISLKSWYGKRMEALVRKNQHKDLSLTGQLTAFYTSQKLIHGGEDVYKPIAYWNEEFAKFK